MQAACVRKLHALPGKRATDSNVEQLLGAVNEARALTDVPREDLLNLGVMFRRDGWVGSRYMGDFRGFHSPHLLESKARVNATVDVIVQGGVPGATYVCLLQAKSNIY
jgi:hypothetical protein